MISVLAVVGPTASGKTALAVELAERLGTEIISADSMQVYAGMEIGTAAPTPEDRARVTHHLVGFLKPDQPCSAGDFERLARPIVESLNRYGKIAVVVGGSGLYVSALIDGLFEGPPANDAIREHLHYEAEKHGVAPLFERLQDTDPAYADLIQPNDLRRIVRALEVHEVTGRTLTSFHQEHQQQGATLNAVQIAIDLPRDVLYRRIDLRVDRMLANGFVDEVQQLLDAGYRDAIERLRSLGYRDFAAYLEGHGTFEDARESMKRNTRRFAKRQLTWFRADPRIHWIPGTDETSLADYVGAAMRVLRPDF
ncbi:MAG: tRNA (adenosine(37)-N6)-dimethylallyltransferase MiaA [Bryobacteraceae bacterium]|nr:tRNA (adenosine(37)-N6)-dimethylallyltransferase MiaA [Bryobacteraceae bacterium]